MKKGSGAGQFAFIIGSPRSGTTILGEVLDAHPDISQWYEPYFVWDKNFRERPDDLRSAQDATPAVKRQIRKAFEDYSRAKGAKVVVDKSPRNCLKVPFVHAIFPEGKFIFLFRDGRDTVLSIHKEWLRRKSILQRDSLWGRAREVLPVVRTWLGRQPLWRHRLEAILFEAGSPASWLRGEFLHRKRWDGRIGWGPRFKGWRELMERCSLLEFVAHQWSHCAEGFLDHMEEIPEAQRFVLRYEDFVEDPRAKLEELLEFLGLKSSPEYFDAIPRLKAGNFGKWRKEFTPRELEAIIPIIRPCLLKMGYEIEEGEGSAQ
jgi:hypothetical protein